MVTRDILHLTTDTFFDVGVKRMFEYYPLTAICSECLSRGSNNNTLCITRTGNVFLAR